MALAMQNRGLHLVVSLVAQSLVAFWLGGYAHALPRTTPEFNVESKALQHSAANSADESLTTGVQADGEYVTFEPAGGVPHRTLPLLEQLSSGVALSNADEDYLLNAGAGCTTVVGECFNKGCGDVSPRESSCVSTIDKPDKSGTCSYTTTRKPSTCIGNLGCTCQVPVVTVYNGTRLQQAFSLCPNPGSRDTICTPP